jgi:flagellar biosynthesis anti-sigma factor FlgM
VHRPLKIQAASNRRERIVKIDAYRNNVPLEALDRAGKPAAAVGNRDAKASAPATAANDEVRLSSDARLMQTVMQNAQQALNVRQDVVERMRAALANGKVGNDPHALADALLDRLIGTSPQKQQ